MADTFTLAVSRAFPVAADNSAGLRLTVLVCRTWLIKK